VPESTSRTIASILLSRSTRTIGQMVNDGRLLRTPDGHVVTASIGAMLGHPITAENFAAALAWQKARTHRDGVR